ncbi:MAG: ParB-like protein [Pseudobdellovibrio sp.]
MKKPDILDLCPTQFVLGMKEIEFKVEKINKFSDRELKEYCDDHVIPVVIGPPKTTIPCRPPSLCKSLLGNRS